MKAIHLSEKTLQRLELFMDVRERMDSDVDVAGVVCDCDACMRMSAPWSGATSSSARPKAVSLEQRCRLLRS
jgi:hypothetical protein